MVLSTAPVARAVMVLGCTSGAGKSWIATALCRWYATQGLRVAPFKAQNMSNHARVVAIPGHGVGEIGSAQYFQARAAGIEPDVRMNPILLKPEANTHSQVVVLGAVAQQLSAMPWRQRAAILWRTAQSALEDLQREFDLLVIEGAGSPAEINLADVDYVNTRTAIASQASCVLVANIDHGGAFAHLFGTAALMDATVRDQLRGFVLNGFRGDASLLSPGPERLQELTGIPTLAVVPMLREHGLPEEDAVPHDAAGTGGPLIVVVAAPHVSNLDEFEALRAAGLRVAFARDPASIARADWLILPGSKQARADLAWMEAHGLDTAIRAHAQRGRPLLAVCGGLQIAGEWLEDSAGSEGGRPGISRGLGLLPVTTVYGAQKRLTRRVVRLGSLEGPWSPLTEMECTVYEIHTGITRLRADASLPRTITTVTADDGEPLGWQCGSVLGTYVHGLFEDARISRRLFGVSAPDLETTFDRMAEVIERSFGRPTLTALAQQGA